jgi:uncharacterized protein YbaP (TraB family)
VLSPSFKNPLVKDPVLYGAIVFGSFEKTLTPAFGSHCFQAALIPLIVFGYLEAGSKVFWHDIIKKQKPIINSSFLFNLQPLHGQLLLLNFIDNRPSEVYTGYCICVKSFLQRKVGVLKKFITRNLFCAIVIILLVSTGLFFFFFSPAAAGQASSVWKISMGDNTLYLGGSVHILRKKDFPLPAAFDKAYSQSSFLVLETDIDRLEEPEMQEYLQSRMLLPGDATLRSLLDSDTHKLLAAECQKYGLSINAVEKLKPSMVITVLNLYQMQKMGFTQTGIDQHYLDKSKEENKPVRHLEAPETQINMLVGMGEGYENEYVRYSLKDMEGTGKGLNMLLTEWKRGKAAISEASLAEMKKEWPFIYRDLVANRNDAWVPQIKTFLASGELYFVIVGLLHLHGPDGLLRQLKDAGCTVEQLK